MALSRVVPAGAFDALATSLKADGDFFARDALLLMEQDDNGQGG
jgi:hypothetical protein